MSIVRQVLKTGKEHLESLRDGRRVYIGRRLVEDVTTDPAFARAAQTIADLYDVKAEPNNHDVMSYVDDDGGRFNSYFIRARTRDELTKRLAAHQRIADLSYGFLGRSPDYVASFVTGMATPRRSSATAPTGSPPTGDTCATTTSTPRMRSSHRRRPGIPPTTNGRTCRSRLCGPSPRTTRESSCTA
ncbi:hypothetical protein C1I99_05250 [Micromonospora deserti]|uniref:HpaB/PvcC/4-BUDH N-terminal domain-containing protein n=1 Tax=Micromonospora deserti TaxID=2070366 RepID=A0A2W2CVC7_9ACTN|nr:hypothetical protein C1I99_05250 [Micromonospora deserti]